MSLKQGIWLDNYTKDFWHMHRKTPKGADLCLTAAGLNPSWSWRLLYLRNRLLCEWLHDKRYTERHIFEIEASWHFHLTFSDTHFRWWISFFLFPQKLDLEKGWPFQSEPCRPMTAPMRWWINEWKTINCVCVVETVWFVWKVLPHLYVTRFHSWTQSTHAIPSIVLKIHIRTEFSVSLMCLKGLNCLLMNFMIKTASEGNMQIIVTALGYKFW